MTDTTLLILEAFAAARTPLGVSELQASTGIPPATLARLLKKLVGLDYISRSGHGVYTGGAALFSLGTAILNCSLSSRFLPLLRKLVSETGLNAELYHLTSQGPQLLCWEGGMSSFQVRMAPGHRVCHPGHPAIYFHQLLYPEAAPLPWGGQGAVLADGEREDFLRQARENFVIERGHILPEVGRACAATADGAFVFGLSGLRSEFASPDAELKTLMHRLIR